MTHPQNPFSTSPASQNPFASHPQNPFSSTIEDEPSAVSLGLHGLKAEAAAGLELVMFPFNILSGGKLGGNINIRELRRMRAQVAAADPGSAFGNPRILARLDADIAKAEEHIRAQAAHLRYQVAKARSQGNTQLPEVPLEERRREQLRAAFGVPEARTGVAATPEPGSLAEVGSFVMAIPNHLLTAFVNAKTPEEQAEAIGTAAIAIGATVAPFAKGRAKPVDLPKVVAGGITAGVTRSVMSDLAQRATLENVPVRGVQFTREIETPTQRADRLSDDQAIQASLAPFGEDITLLEAPPTAHVGAEVRPGEVFRGSPAYSLKEAELAAIKQRLFREAEGDLSRTLIAAHKELTPFGTTVIPGIEQGQSFSIAQSIVRAEEVLQGGTVTPGKEIIHSAIHYKPDGTADIAIYGDRSPLMDKVKRIQFSQTGYFVDQEVSWNGRNGVVVDVLPSFPKRQEAVGVRFGEERIIIGVSELRRPPYTASAEPFSAELHTRAYTTGDIINIMDEASKVIDPEFTAARRSLVPTVFEAFIAQLTHREPVSTVTGQLATTNYGFKPGVSVHPLYERYTALEHLGTPENLPMETSVYVYADPNGQAVGYMEVASLFNFGLPGTGISKIKGVPAPARHGAAVVNWEIHPQAPIALQARAALALMEKAGELKISQLLAPVDEAGARLAARYMNAYMPPLVEVKNIRARVQEVTPNLNALYKDFKVYHDNIGNGRFGGDGFDHVVQAFAKERGFLPEEVAGLNRYLSYRIAKESREIYFTPEEKATFNSLEKNMRKEAGLAPGEPGYGPLSIVSRMEPLPLDYLAASNNMLAEWTPNGIVEVRMRETGDLLGRFRDEQAARNFINGTGQAEGPHLDGGGAAHAIPPGAAGGSVMPPSPPRPPTNAVADGLSSLPPGDRIPRISDWLRTQLEYVSPMEGWISAIDNSFGSAFSPGFRATQAALRRAQSPMLDALKRLHKEVDEPFFKGLTIEERAMIYRAIETMTPDEVISKGFYRSLNDNEINVANWLAARHIDTARTLKYSRELIELEKNFFDDPEALNAKTAELTQRYGLDQDHVIAAATFNEIRKKNPQEIFIGHITRLADAIMSDAPSRAEFIKEHGMSPKTHEAIRRLESILDEVANKVGIPNERRIRGWIAHFRAQMEPKGTLSQAFLGQRGLSEIPEIKFLNELARTGEISMVETDPVISATRYIRGAFLSQEFIPTWNSTLKTWQAELGKLPVGARQKVERVLKSYLSELRGIPEASRTFTEEIWKNITGELGMTFAPEFNKSVVNTAIAASSAGTMAFRLGMGLRDLVSGAMVGYSWFGAKRFKRMMELGWDDAAVKSLHDKGLIPPALTPIEISSPVDLQTSVLLHKLPSTLNRVADLGLKGSLQPLVYDRLNAGAYLEAHELASRSFTDMAAGKISRAKAYENMMIDAYEPSFIREFDGLVDAAKYEDAAGLLATQTQRMITPTYGLANHPYKWGTNSGRLIGQFGTWPTWLATNLLRMATRGSRATRFKVLSRLAMTQAAIYLTGKALGFDLYSWFLFTGLRWLGGPVVGSARAFMNLFSPSELEQTQARMEVARLIPSPSDPRSLYLPGSYAAGDWLQAFGMLGDPVRRPSNLVEVLGRGIGIPVAKEPSWLDQLTQ